MAEKRPERPSRGRPHRPEKDITPILTGWEYEPGTINVRKVMGQDGMPKIQMRLDLGLLQMELNGRPDGGRPYGCESLLDYFEQQLSDYNRSHNGTAGFRLTPEQCQNLRDEAMMYYHRYLSLFVLGDYSGVARDTERNLRVIDLCAQFAEDEQDRLVLEQYRPYITMMNARARASLQVKDRNYRRAWSIIRGALKELKEFFIRFGQEEAYRHSHEVRVLKRFGREVKKHLPTDPMKELQKQLDRAVKDERYEEAAKLRDEILKRQGSLP